MSWLFLKGILDGNYTWVVGKRLLLWEFLQRDLIILLLAVIAVVEVRRYFMLRDRYK